MQDLRSRVIRMTRSRGMGRMNSRFRTALPGAKHQRDALARLATGMICPLPTGLCLMNTQGATHSRFDPPTAVPAIPSLHLPPYRLLPTRGEGHGEGTTRRQPRRKGCVISRQARGFLTPLASTISDFDQIGLHKRPCVGASRPRSWSHLPGLGAISWAFIAKY